MNHHVHGNDYDDDDDDDNDAANDLALNCQ